MQIPPTSLAASLAAISAQTAIDKDVKTDATSSAQQIHVEQSGESNPDRDAQGQGDGLPSRKNKREEMLQSTSPPSESNHQDHAAAPNLPGEPPSQLDLLG
jgi:hypothetical protein